MVHLNFAVNQDVKTGEGMIAAVVSSVIAEENARQIRCGLRGELLKIMHGREGLFSAFRFTTSENLPSKPITLIERVKRAIASRLIGSKMIAATLRETSNLLRGLKTQ